MNTTVSDPNLMKACARFQYLMNMLQLPEYREKWQAMQKLSNTKKKELEDYRLGYLRSSVK